MRKLIFPVLAVLAIAFPLAAAVDLSGTWEMTMVTPRGEMKSDLALVAAGEKLTVTLTRPGRDGTPVEHKGEGTVKGSDIEWTISRQGHNGGEMKIIYKGTIVDNDHLKGTMEMSGGPGGMPPGGTEGEGTHPPKHDWTAVRKTK